MTITAYRVTNGMNNKFVIKFDEVSDLFVMNGWAERTVGAHLENLAKVFGVLDVFSKATSESHALAILQSSGVSVEIEGGW